MKIVVENIKIKKKQDFFSSEFELKNEDLNIKILLSKKSPLFLICLFLLFCCNT